MQKFGSMLALVGAICSMVFPTHELMSQTKEGFYDTNNYDLRNVPGYDPEGNILKDVDQPPSFQKPQLVNPKDVRTQYDPLASIPGAGAVLPITQQLPSNNQYQSTTNSPLTNSPINPLTGEINPAALQNQGNRSRAKKEAAKKLREEYDDEAVYKETKFRRGYIIFFLTLPFALGVSAAVASAPVLLNTMAGSFVMLTGTLGLCGANVYLDQERLEEARAKKTSTTQTNP
ncbi:MAG: hypothetical protein O9264_03985 [Leptospira sp.]|nr:hypothetical protein [Leptospira sp.]